MLWITMSFVWLALAQLTFKLYPTTGQWKHCLLHLSEYYKLVHFGSRGVSPISVLGILQTSTKWQNTANSIRNPQGHTASLTTSWLSILSLSELSKMTSELDMNQRVGVEYLYWHFLIYERHRAVQEKSILFSHCWFFLCAWIKELTSIKVQQENSTGSFKSWDTKERCSVLYK